MQKLRALTIPGFIAAAWVSFGCSSSDQGDGFFPPASTGGSIGAGSGTGTGGTTGTSMSGGQGPGIMFGGSGNGTAGSAGGPAVEKCTGTSAGSTPLPPILEFLIDYSGSMNETPMGQMQRKYQATASALIQAFTDMADGTGTGLIFYPNTGGKGGGTCINRQQAVQVQALDAMVRQSLISALMAKTTSGATPTHDAFNYAVDTVAASTLMGNKYVVLVTDGAPTYALNCMGDGQTPADNAPLIQAVADANNMRGIKTFVIGSPGSEPARAALSQMALQGGTAPAGCSDMGPTYCHFDMTTAPDLSAALNDAFKAITGSVITCNYTIPPPTNGMMVDPKQVNVTFTGSNGGNPMTIAKDPDPPGGACNQGWQYNANSTQIQLCPDTCNLVKADPNAKIDVVLGCTTMVR
jgi:hypothetical protein